MIAASAIHSGMLGQRLQDLDDALDDQIEDAAVIAGEPADDDAEHEADGDAEQADGQRDARAVDDARQHVAPEPVGAEQEQLAALGRADEMEVRSRPGPRTCRHRRGRRSGSAATLFGLSVYSRFSVSMLSVIVAAIDEGPDEAALVEQMDRLRRRMDEVDVARVQIVGRQELDDERSIA